MNTIDQVNGRAFFSAVKSVSLVKEGLIALFGALFLSMMAQVALPLPFTPVPLTMQTFGLFTLALFMGKYRATSAVILYLLAATAGFPLLAGAAANPAWIFFPTAGYLFGFAACTYTIGFLLERGGKSSFIKTLFSMAIGQLIIYAMGSIYLSLFVGLENALFLGVVPFLFSDALKLTLAASLSLFGLSERIRALG